MGSIEKTIAFLEQDIPEQAEVALKQAYWKALSEGFSVLVIEDGELIEKHPDGTQKVLKKIRKPSKAIPGEKWEIK